MTFARPVLFALLAASLVGFRTDDTYALRHKVVKDEAVTYRYTMHAVGEGTDVAMDGKSHAKVVKVEDDGTYEVEITMLEGKVNANGTEIQMGSAEPQTVKYGKDGKPVRKDGEETILNINTMLEEFGSYEPEKPVKLGDAWTKECRYGDVKFTLEAKEKIGGKDCVKISFSAKLNKNEAEGSATGTYYLRADDYSVEKSDCRIENGPSVIESTMERVD